MQAVGHAYTNTVINNSSSFDNKKNQLVGGRTAKVLFCLLDNFLFNSPKLLDAESLETKPKSLLN